MKQLWIDSGFKKRVSMVVGMGWNFESAKGVARLTWDSLPMSLRQALSDEFAHTGDPS